jgi:predicted lipoprotein with Yx(FWY)xxD motif
MRRGQAITALAALALSLTACGSSTPATTADGGLKAAPADLSKVTLLAVAESSQVGWHVTDGDGLPLYRYDKDTPKPSKSTCEGDCANAWKPVQVDNDPMAAGVDPGLIGTVTRADGTKQLTIAGWPQYTFAEDKTAGDLKGQAKGGVWFATAPNGAKITGAKAQNNSKTGTGTGTSSGKPSTPAPSPSASAPGY